MVPIEKIRNLLALAESPNEYEARSALLKARELMAKYKISEKQAESYSEETVIREVTGITYSARRDPWISDLATCIAEYHCCRDFHRKQKKKQTIEVGFIGLSDDAQICIEVFKYAAECVRHITDKLKKQKGAKAANAYGFGFTIGLEDAYNRQQKENDWALVLVVPEAVNNAIKGMKTVKTKTPKIEDMYAREFRQGIMDGHKFHEQKRVMSDKEKSTAIMQKGKV